MSIDPHIIQAIAFLALPAVGLVLVTIAALKHLLYICAPNQILIFSGRSRVTADGRMVGYRVVFGGRALRIPVLETVASMDMSLISVPMTVQGAYSEGGIPLAVHAIANVKISSDRQHVGNAIERFLGRGRDEIARVAKETLEGHLRGVLATMTPEEVNEDRLKFASVLGDEAVEDLRKLGLQLDTLKIQHVSDDRKYLDSIGRKRIAEILRAAEVAESDAQRAAAEAESAARARGQVAMTNAQAVIQRKQNEVRRLRAQLDAEARAEEEKALASAQAARAQAELELQAIRGELEGLRLAADITIPAEAGRVVRELEAAGAAAQIAEDGRASAQALASIAEAWGQPGGRAMDIFVLQHLDEIFSAVAEAARRLEVREVNLVDAGEGRTVPAYLRAFPAAVAALLGQLHEILGVDISGLLRAGEAALARPPGAAGAANAPR